jgi:hypothetical protein
MNWKGFERTHSLPILDLARNFPEATEKATKNLNQDTGRSIRASDPGPPECELDPPFPSYLLNYA